MFSSSIGKILEDPRSYEGRTITIRGEVTSSWNLLLLRGFWLRDQTGEIPVVTERAVPRVGERLSIRGRVEQIAAVGSLRVTVVREQLP